VLKADTKSYCRQHSAVVQKHMGQNAMAFEFEELRKQYRDSTDFPLLTGDMAYGDWAGNSPRTGLPQSRITECQIAESPLVRAFRG